MFFLMGRYNKAMMWRLLASCVLMTAARGEFSLQARFHSYQNPLHAAAGLQGDCCDNAGNDDPPNCRRTCDNQFTFRLLVGATGVVVGEYVTEVVQRNNDHLVFSPGEGSTFGRVPNPLVFEGLNDSILEHLELSIEVFDDDYSDPSEFIDAIAISFEDMPLSTLSFTAPAVFNGTHGLTEATLSFGLECAVNYFGENCTLFCTNADNDLIGHYLCDERGNRVCRDGYVNPSTACTQLAPLEGSDEDNSSKYITIIAVLAVVALLAVPTTAIITSAVLKLRRRQPQCECSRRMEMEGNPAYAMPQTNHTVTSHRTSSHRYLTNDVQNGRAPNLVYCQAYAVSSQSLATVATSVDVGEVCVSGFSEEDAGYSKASVGQYSEITAEDLAGMRRRGSHSGEQGGYEDVWEAEEEEEEGNYASLRRVEAGTDGEYYTRVHEADN